MAGGRCAGRLTQRFAITFAVQLCGCALLGAGLWLRFANRGYATLLPEHAALSADSLLVTVGTLSVVLTFFGTCGAWFQSRCMLIVVRVFSRAIVPWTEPVQLCVALSLPRSTSP